MKTHTTKNAEHGLVGNVETSEANNTETAKLFNCWLWPDHAISRAESRRMRDEHNALVNSHYELLEACKALLEHHGSIDAPRTYRARAQAKAAIAKAKGKE